MRNLDPRKNREQDLETKEQKRLTELFSYAQLDTKADPDLDAIAELAAQLCGSSGGMVNLIDSDRQWSKSLFGLDKSWGELKRSDSMCTHTIQGQDILEVTNFRTDPRFKNHNLAREDSGVEHYAGAPLVSPSGSPLGALCVISDKPGKLSDQQKQSLRKLSKLTMTILNHKNPLNRLLSGVAQRSNGILYLDPQTGELAYGNDRMSEITGLRQLELVGKAASDLCETWTAEFFQSLDGKKAEASLQVPEKFTLACGDHTRAPVAVRWNLMDHYGKPLLVAVVEDRSAESASEAASEERNMFFELSRDVIVVWDSKGRIQDINPSFTRVLGYRLSELKNSTSLDLIHPEDQEATRQDFKQLNNGAINAGHVNRVRHADGHYLWMSWTSVMSPGKTIYASGQDITSSREQNRELQLLRRAIECSQNPFIVANLEQPGGVVEYVNSAFTAVTGYEKSDVIGRNCGFLQGKDKNQPGIQRIRDALKAKADVHTLLRNYRKDGSMFWNELYLAPVEGENNEVTHYIGVQYDVTELVNQRDQIVRLNRIEALRSAFNSAAQMGSSSVSLGSELCEVAVTIGQYPLVWIASAAAGTDDWILESAHGAFSELLRQGEKISGLPTKWLVPFLEPALVNHEPVILQQLGQLGLSQETEYRLQQEGFRSLGIFPIVRHGKVQKLACFYSGEVNAFDAKENVVIMNLLEDYSVAEQLASSVDELKRVVQRNEITGLPNQSLLASMSRDLLPDDSDSLDGNNGAFLTVIIDGLIEIIGQIGRIKGQTLLKMVASKLQQNLPKAAILGHTDFAHFTMFLQNMDDRQSIVDYIEQTLLPVFDQSFSLDRESDLYLTVRVGVTTLPSMPADLETTIDHSKVAAASVTKPHQHFQFYSESLTESARQAARQETELREAIRLDQFELHFQPKVDLHANRLSGMEGLLRWNHPDHGLVSPGYFIPLLETSGLIVHLTLWLLREAHQAASEFNKHTEIPLRIAINLSQIQLQQPNFLSLVDQFMADYEVTADNNLVDLEITESLLADDVEATGNILRALRERGFQIAIDDFGTGYSSLSYLARLPFDALKIDLSFIRRMTDSVEDMSIVSTIIGLSKSLNKKVIAEGVETREQANLLRLINCTTAQGYLISRPMQKNKLIGSVPMDNVIDYSGPAT